MDCALKLYRNGGVKNLYVGTGATILRDLPASGVYFSVYDILMRLFANHFKEVIYIIDSYTSIHILKD